MGTAVCTKIFINNKCSKVGQLAMPETCENRFGLINNTALLDGFQSSRGALKFIE